MHVFYTCDAYSKYVYKQFHNLTYLNNKINYCKFYATYAPLRFTHFFLQFNQQYTTTSTPLFTYRLDHTPTSRKYYNPNHR